MMASVGIFGLVVALGLVVAGAWTVVLLTLDGSGRPRRRGFQGSPSIEAVGEQSMTWAAPAVASVTGRHLYRRLTLSQRGLTMDVVSRRDVELHSLLEARSEGPVTHWTFEELEGAVENLGYELELTKEIGHRRDKVHVGPWSLSAAADIVEAIERAQKARAGSAMPAADSRQLREHLSRVAPKTDGR